MRAIHKVLLEMKKPKNWTEIWARVMKREKWEKKAKKKCKSSLTHMKRCSLFLKIREMLIKTLLNLKV